MGPTYLVRHTELDAVFVLRRLAPERAADPAWIARFERGARLVARLRHPAIVRVLDILRDDEGIARLEEVVEAEPLSARTLAGWTARDVLGVALQLTDALEYAHAQGATHGRLDPSNVLVSDDPAARAFVTDLWPADVDAPDDASADEAVRADVRGVALVLLDMLGRRTAASIPDPLAAVLARATDADPANRHADMASLTRDLERCRQSCRDEAPPVDVAAPAPAGGFGEDLTMTVAIPAPVESARVEIPSPPAEDVSVVVPIPTPAARTAAPIWLALAGVLVAVLAFVGGRRLFETPAPPPLAWTRLAPSTADQDVTGGSSLVFAADTGQATTTWFVDDVAQGTGTSWTMSPDAAARGTSTVRAEARRGAEHVEHVWTVRIAPANRAPIIDGASPEGDRVVVPAGKSQRFTVVARDPDDERGALTFAWESDGQPQAAGSDPSWTLSNVAHDMDVRVTVSDAHGLRAPPKVWHVTAVANPAPLLTARPAPGTPLSLDERETVELGVRANAPPAETTYDWRIDSKPAGQRATLTFAAPPTAGTAVERHAITVDVAVGGGPPSRASWEVAVRPLAPVLTAFQPPLGRLRATRGRDTEFMIEARGRGGQRLQYEWTVDGQPRPGGRDGTFVLPDGLAPGRHEVAGVALDDRGLRSSPQRWQVDVDEAGRAATPPARPERAAPPAGPLTEEDVRAWLVRFREAWEQRNARALRALGVVTSDAEERGMAQALADVRQLRVVVRNERIELDGAEAVVSFDRVDVRGAQAMPQGRQTYRLGRSPAGSVVIVRERRAGVAP